MEDVRFTQNVKQIVVAFTDVAVLLDMPPVPATQNAGNVSTKIFIQLAVYINL